MILVDTSIWVDHLREAEPLLTSLLEAGRILIHPFVIGELALGGLRRQSESFERLCELPSAVQASDDEVMSLIFEQRLAGSGIGFVDAHLLAAARLTPDARIWTRDQKLLAAAERLSLAARPHDA